MNASEQITNYISELIGWRGEMLRRLRQVILDSAPGIVEEWKWDTPVFSHNGSVVALGAFQDHLKINFFKGASLDDPRGLFKAGLEAKKTRAIDIFEGEDVDLKAIKDLVRAAVALNDAKTKSR
jgi:hypothetical protein